MISQPISQLLKRLRREERNPNFSPQNRTFRELLARTPLDLHGYLEHQIFQKNEIQDLRCPGDDCAHFDYWRERADFVSSDRVSEILDQKIDDLRQEVEQTFSEIMGREAEIVGEIVARRGVAEAVEHIEQMHIRAFVI